MSVYVYELEPERENNTGAAIYQAARAGGPRVLDIGSGPGIIAAHLAKHDGKDVTCLDYDEPALASAREQGVTATHVVDLRDERWFEPVAGERYDVVIMADVLEHLVDPERVLADLAREKLLADDGRLVVSVPNASHEAVLVELATGHFSYTDTGLLDRTHLRFFTLDSMTVLLENHGFFVSGVHRTMLDLTQTRQRHRSPDVSPTLRAALDEMGLESRTFQYVLTVLPATEAGRILELEARLEEARSRVHAAETKRAAAVHEAQVATAAAERDRASAERAGAEAAHLRAEVDRLGGQVTKLRKQLEAMRSSTTWRAGSAVSRVASPVTGLRRKLKG